MRYDTASFFTSAMLGWNENYNDRSLPWKDEKDPYKIWLSEIILQQTRALQGMPYYLQFIDTYPTIKDLAAAGDEDVFRIWQGLGYYNRCKNMLATARQISSEQGGRFPDTYEEIIALKGIGPYTAAAIASFAFGLPYAVVDGNVYRVLSRYFGIETPSDTSEGKKIFSNLAQELLPTEQSAAYNQAIMDLGATVCKPQAPVCADCPLQKNCFAFARELTAVLPVKSKKISVATRYFHYLIMQFEDRIWLHKRMAKDIWENLYEPYLIEYGQALDTHELMNTEQFKNVNLIFTEIHFEGDSAQRLTHRIIRARFYTVTLPEKPLEMPMAGIWLPVSELGKIAFPKTVVSFLKKKYYF